MKENTKGRLLDAVKPTLTKYQLTKKKLLLIFLGFVALIVLLDGLNKPHFSPFKEKLSMDHPCHIVMDENGGVICDRQHTRLIILNEKQEMQDMVSLTISGSPINWAGKMIISGDEIYVLGAVYTNQGMYLESESVQVYSLSGKYERELYKKTYEKGDMETHPHLLTLWMDEGKLHLCGQSGETFFIQTIDDSGNLVDEKDYTAKDQIMSADMLGDQLVAYSRDFQIYIPDDLTGELRVPVDVAESSAVMNAYVFSSAAIEKLESIPTFDQLYVQFDDHHQRVNIFCISEEEGKIYQYNDARDEITEFSEITISPWWTFKNLLFWLFVAYVIGILLAGIWWLLIIKKKLWEWQAFLALVLVVMLVTGIYSYYSSNRIKSIYTTEISMLDQQVSAELQNGYKDILSDVSTQGLYTYVFSEKGKTRLSELENFLTNMSSACGKDVGFFIDVLAVDADGTVRMLADSRRTEMRGGSISKDFPDFTENPVVSKTSDANGKYLLEQYKITPTGSQTAYIVESGCYEGNLYKQLRTEAVNLLVNLLALLITFWISFSVLKDIPKSIKAYKEKSRQGDPDAPVALTGLFTFIQQTVSLLDVVILVYVVKSMLSANEQQYLTWISALVIAIFSAGKLLGNFLVFQMRIRIGERKMGMLASAGGFGAYLMMAFAVMTSHFGIFILGKFIGGVFVDSHLLVLSRGLPLGSKNESTRTWGLNKNQQAYTAGAILSALLAGYLSQYISYTAIYFVGAILCVPMFLVARRAFKPGLNQEAKDWFLDMKKETKGLIGLIKRLPWMFYKTPLALSFVLLYTFPFVLTNGYQTYLFPLFSASAGISALLLSNITVFGQAIAYLTNTPVMKLTQNWDRLRTMIGAMAILCGCFVCFYLSPNIWWAIIVLFIQYILFRIPRVGTTVYLSELAEQEGYEPMTVQPTYYSIENIFTSVLQAPILETFVSLGVNYACAALGLLCSVFIGVYALLTGQRRKKEENGSVQVNENGNG